LDTENIYTGFSAQNVQKVIPEAVGKDRNGNLTLSDRPILAAIVNAIKELAERWLKPIIGSSAEPAGITVYDKVTHMPYCLEMINGQLQPTTGECSTVEKVQVQVKNETIIDPKISTSTDAVIPEEIISNASTTPNVSSPDSNQTSSSSPELNGNATSTDVQ
jgi:hypothetical protein